MRSALSTMITLTIILKIWMSTYLHSHQSDDIDVEVDGDDDDDIGDYFDVDDDEDDEESADYNRIWIVDDQHICILIRGKSS